MRYLYLLFLCFLASNQAHGQSFFKIISEDEANKNVNTDRSIIPNNYQVSELDIEEIRRHLTSKVGKKDEGELIYLPNPEGKMIAYQVFETKMMQEGLAAKYPGIRTYKGYNPDRKYEKIHFGISNTGFYATVSQVGATYSIDRYADKQNKYYISYYARDHEEDGTSYTCGTEGSKMSDYEVHTHNRSAGDLLPLREYRFAVATTGEFGSFYGPEVEDVLAELVKSVNRMNLILENDFAIRLVLVNDNDLLINLDPNTDPYPDGNTGGILLGQNTMVIANKIGFANFDLGHVYTRACDDTGGIASIRSVCTANKGAGVTCHYSNDITAMAVRVAAHEVGHQLGSNHTFNNCDGNENGSTAFEPGSGTTIMSYAGLCGQQLNVINTANDYFHVSSLIEIISFTRDLAGDNCPERVTTENHIPDIEIPIEGGFSIPISTPFELEGVATDEDGDDLTYTWEQYNLGPKSTPGSPMGNSPLFISIYPSPNPKRVFPQISTIINNEEDKREVLPSYERDLNFQFVVRDNNPESGGVAWSEIEFYATESAGPFLVEFPSADTTFEVGEEIEILWDVANTNNEIVNCQSVNILLSTDGGFTYERTLLENTPNDGAEKILIPNLVGNSARIRIEAADNIFFDISNEDFQIAEPTEPGFLFTYTPSYSRTCVPDDIVLEFTTEGFLGYSEAIQFELEGEIPAGLDLNFSENTVLPGESTSATITFSDNSLAGLIPLNIRALSGTDTLDREIILDLVSSDFSDLAPVFPIVGSSGNLVSPILQWKGDSDATEYIVKLSDNPSFDDLQSEVLYIETVSDTFFELDDILAKNTVYYWQVEAVNECGSTEDPEIYAFATEAISCGIFQYNDVPVGISQSGVIELDLPIEVLGGGQVSDVNVLKLRGSHSWVSELKGELFSPSGTKVQLFRNKCGNQIDFNMGFDDDAVGGITCPLSQGIFYQPQEKLDTFIGEDVAGQWLLKLTDTQIGNGGSLQEYTLEVCSNEVLDAPILVTNEVMPLPSGVGRRISPDFLKAEDANNDSDELIFTIVRLPRNGTLRNEDAELSVGSRFSQAEIDQSRIRYQHNGESEEDNFLFTVTDGEGGWVSVTSFEIGIDNDVVLDVNDVIVPDYQIFPNPASDHINIVFSDYHGDIEVEIYDVLGRRLGFSSEVQNGGFQIRFLSPVSGILLVNIKGEGFSDVRKIMVE